jgi:hypothetical protein
MLHLREGVLYVYLEICLVVVAVASFRDTILMLAVNRASRLLTGRRT